ncbi:MAG: methyltransferase domain-containing protein [Acidobacteria bacterium]|nr:methyltransferase domain-containing protein [Acidobacteriota bacterium]
MATLATAQREAAPALQPQPNPALIFETLNAFQRSAALRGAIELDIFTVIAQGANTPEAIALRCQASERGVRILCDYLTVIGFLTKQNNRYGLTPDSATFLDRRSPAYMGTMAKFLNAPKMMEQFQDLADVVRLGQEKGTNEDGSASDDNAFWIEFARSMVPLMTGAAQEIAGLLGANQGAKWKVLDIAAGHGIFGITIAQQNQNAEIVAVDWPSVLKVARENAEKLGVAQHYQTIEGSAFEADYGDGYDVILLTNFLHHFDVSTCEKLLRKIWAALKSGGRVATLEMVPNENRISPPIPAAFALQMLGGTPRGDAYTFSELDRMFRAARFSKNELYDLATSPERVIISTK